MRRLCALLVIVLLVASSRAEAQSKPTVGVATVLDGPSPVFEQQLEDLRTEIKTQLSDRFEIIWVALPVAGDWTAQNVEGQ
ncbi:MAG: hypothetical protein PVH76_12670, partial [Myxococcales bacterium]